MTKSLQSRKRQLVEDAIDDAAIDLFAKKGFDETTVEEVADAAGPTFLLPLFCDQGRSSGSKHRPLRRDSGLDCRVMSCELRRTRRDPRNDFGRREVH